jgi:hypothetical protein
MNEGEAKRMRAEGTKMRVGMKTVNVYYSRLGDGEGLARGTKARLWYKGH